MPHAIHRHLCARTKNDSHLDSQLHSEHLVRQVPGGYLIEILQHKIQIESRSN